LEQTFAGGRGKIYEADDRMREIGLLRDLLQPARLAHRVGRIEVGLHMDRFREAEAGRVLQEVGDQVRFLQRLQIAPAAIVHRPLEPRPVSRAGVPEVMMSVDDQRALAALKSAISAFWPCSSRMRSASFGS